ncbi:MAG: FAD-dependent oxidoreductase, partial [Synechococcus sp. ArSW.bin.68]
VSTAGVCCPDGNELAPWQTGLWGAFLRALYQSEPKGLDQNWVSCFGYRPTTAEQILQNWVQVLPNLQWWEDCQLLDVERSRSAVQAVLIQRAGGIHRIGCDVVIDGSDRGDLLPLADAPFRFGWEGQELWEEPSAPCEQRLKTESFFLEQPVQSPTWVVMGQLKSDRLLVDPASGLDPDGTPLLPEPFEQACAAFGLERTISYGRLPGGLVMLNWPLHGNDWHRGLERAFGADPKAEQELMTEMQVHSLHFADELQRCSAGWLTRGEAFPQEAGSPAPWLAAMPYWREGRRMIGLQTVIEQDLLPQTTGQSIAALPLNAAGALESIAVGNYANDHHYPGSDWPLAPKSCRWGGRWSGTPFCIPYQALVSAELDNLLTADKCLSTSHMANGATRLQPLIFNVGQAAGAAAALSIRHRRPLADLPVRLIQELLIEEPTAPSGIVPLWDTAWHHPSWQMRQRACLDNPDLVGADGCWLGQEEQVSMAPPPQPQQAVWSGTLVLDHKGGYELELVSGRRWPLITLEPELSDWLANQERAKAIELLAVANAWGPWLRGISLHGSRGI